MTRITYNTVLFCCLLILFGCRKISVEESSRKDLAPFDKVWLNSSFEVYLSEGSEYSVRIDADKDLLEHIKIDVKDSLLTIYNDKKLKWLTPTRNAVKIYITAPPLKSVTANETCFIRTLTPITSQEFGMIFLSKLNNADLNLDCDVFYYWNNYPCGGTLTLDGSCNWLKLWNAAIVDVQAKNLNAKNAEVSNNSKGDCVIRVSEFLKYTLNGEGNIEVYGNPVEIIEYEESLGQGKLIIH